MSYWLVIKIVFGGVAFLILCAGACRSFTELYYSWKYRDYDAEPPRTVDSHTTRARARVAARRARQAARADKKQRWPYPPMQMGGIKDQPTAPRPAPPKGQGW